MHSIQRRSDGVARVRKVHAAPVQRPLTSTRNILTVIFPATEGETFNSRINCTQMRLAAGLPAIALPQISNSLYKGRERRSEGQGKGWE